MSGLDPTGLVELLEGTGDLPEYTHDYLKLYYEARNSDILCYRCAREWWREGEQLEAHIADMAIDCDICGDNIKEALEWDASLD